MVTGYPDIMTPMEIIPAIDIRGGRCVRLDQGDYDRETVFADDPVEVAGRWEEAGARPHMGWNRVHIAREHPIFEGIADGSYFYFVHSYFPQPADPAVVIGETDYGVRFASVVARDNVVATQFHPEKSGENGLKLYGNFLRVARGVAA